MKTFKIAVIPGDGIGKEVMDIALEILEAYTENKAYGFEYTEYPWGCDYYKQTGHMMPEDALDILQAYDAILLGAVGDPSVPDHISLHGLLLKIRQGFKQQVNLRPVKSLKNAPSPIKDASGIDILFVRENVEGEYAGLGEFIFEKGEIQKATQTAIFSRDNTRAVMTYAFKLAEMRKGKITSVTKSNALNYSMVFWDNIFNELGPSFDIKCKESIHVDAMSMYLIQNPQAFDVVVASNLFGDILTDLGAALQGGLGFAASANLNIEGTHPSMFEPVHGSAPAIAGKGIANPMAMVWSVKLMLDHLLPFENHESLLYAIEKTLENKVHLTPDLGGQGSSQRVKEEIKKWL